jgi:ketosteroid isomerase-like protein
VQTVSGDQQLEENKQIAWSLFEALRDGRFQDAIDVLDPEGIWWDYVNPPYIPQTMKAFRAELRVMERGLLDNPLAFVLDRAVAEGDTVALGLHQEGRLSSGRPIYLGYAIFVRIRDRKIVELHEHADTEHGARLYAEFFTSEDNPMLAAWRDILEHEEGLRPDEVVWDYLRPGFDGAGG